MDVEEIWSEHKKFIIAVGVALVALLVFQGVKTAVYTDETGRLRAAVQSHRRWLRASRVVTPAMLRALRAEEERLTRRLRRLERAVETKVPQGYRLPDANVKSHFTRVLQETRDKVAEVASLENVRIPYELGVPSITPNTRDEMDQYLRGLHIVERVVSEGVSLGVRRFDSIEVKPAKGGGFLREIQVTFRLATDGPTLGALCDRLLDPAAPLTLARFHVAHPPRGGEIVATLGISVFDVDPSKPLGEEGAT